MFIAIEGPDGVGKTTLSQSIVSHLNKIGYKAKFTTEPTNTETGKQIRDLLALNSDTSDSFKNKLLDLFIQDRQEHIDDFIKPNLEDDVIIVTDRYKYSTVCYQHLQGVDLDRLLKLNKPFLKPDICFILYVNDTDVLLNRIKKRNTKLELFETKSFLEKCNSLYMDMPKHFIDEYFVFIDAEYSPDNIFQNVLNNILSELENCG